MILQQTINLSSELLKMFLRHRQLCQIHCFIIRTINAPCITIEITLANKNLHPTFADQVGPENFDKVLDETKIGVWHPKMKFGAVQSHAHS